MGLSPRQAAELHELLWQLRAETASPEQLSRLERLVCEDPQARTFYVRYMHLCADLNWNGSVGNEGRGTRGEGREMAGSPAIDGEAGFGVRGSGFGVRDSGFGVPLPPASGLQPPASSPEPPFPTLSTTHYPLPATPFVGSWAFSYMVATVIMGVAILGFWAYKITHHQHIAEAPSQSIPSDAMPEMVFVGRITGMLDVKWSDDPRYLPPPGYAHVPLGRKYILSSGLLEITYDSGAKVILEGPCTYEVESTAGGYLSLGKLTARVGEDKETRRQGDKEKKADAASPHLLVSPSPGLPVSPLFSVRTPTAIVTDLGTEFGVEVSDRGLTKTQVFQGRVEMRLADGGQGEPLTIQLGVGESGQVEHGADGREPTLLRGIADATGFVRVGQLAKLAEQLHPTPLSRWRAWSKELRNRDDLLAYYDFQRDESDRSVLRNRASTGAALDGHAESPAWVSGRFPGKHALRFGWPGNGVRVNIPVECKQLTLLVWVHLDSFPTPPEYGESLAGLLMSDGWSRANAGDYAGRIHWQIRYDGRMIFTLGNWEGDTSSQPVLDDAEMQGHWRQLAVVYVHGPEASRAAFYLDGKRVGAVDMTAAAQPTMAAKFGQAMIGAWRDTLDADRTDVGPPRDRRPLGGRIDELIIFRSALGAEEIHRMYESTKP